MAYHEIIVGNVGKVYEGEKGNEALKVFLQYSSLSKRDYGRCAGESIQWYKDSDIHREYLGSNDKEDQD